MSPRRPAPARPGNRPGAGRRAHDPKQVPGPAARTATPRTEGPGPRSSAASRPAGQASRPSGPSRLQIGGSTGFAVSYRVLVLVVVLVSIIIIVGPAARSFLLQRAEYADARKELAQAQATQTALAQELAKWDDDVYVRAQARQRLGYVMPGETGYVVIGAQDLDGPDQADGGAARPSPAPTPWPVVLTGSVREAARSKPGPTASQVPESPEPAPTVTASPQQESTP